MTWTCMNNTLEAYKACLCHFNQGFVVLDSKLAVIWVANVFVVTAIAKAVTVPLDVSLFLLQLLDLLIIPTSMPDA